MGPGVLEREQTEPITGGVAVEAYRRDRAKLTLVEPDRYVCQQGSSHVHKLLQTIHGDLDHICSEIY